MYIAFYLFLFILCIFIIRYITIPLNIEVIKGISSLKVYTNKLMINVNSFGDEKYIYTIVNNSGEILVKFKIRVQYKCVNINYDNKSPYVNNKWTYSYEFRYMYIETVNYEKDCEEIEPIRKVFHYLGKEFRTDFPITYPDTNHLLQHDRYRFFNLLEERFYTKEVTVSDFESQWEDIEIT